MNANLLTTAEVAEKLNLTDGRIRQFVIDGRLIPERKIGNCYLFLAAKIRDFAKKRRPPGRKSKKTA